MPIVKIISGGQSGVDRAALDIARLRSIAYGGWCPKGGRAEDFPEPPGLLVEYPLLRETPGAAPSQRTAWNVRDSDGVLILTRAGGIGCSPGTVYTQEQAQVLCKPVMVVNIGKCGSVDRVRAWLRGLPEASILNIAGPRESESPGIYDAACNFLDRVLAPDLLA